MKKSLSGEQASQRHQKQSQTGRGAFIRKALAFFGTVLLHVVVHIALENALHPVLHGIGA